MGISECNCPLLDNKQFKIVLRIKCTSEDCGEYLGLCENCLIQNDITDIVCIECKSDFYQQKQASALQDRLQEIRENIITDCNNTSNFLAEDSNFLYINKEERSLFMSPIQYYFTEQIKITNMLQQYIEAHILKQEEKVKKFEKQIVRKPDEQLSTQKNRLGSDTKKKLDQTKQLKLLDESTRAL
ncbi:hypothetical protein PPERSA_09834 [Pseudocohnilembus persalinus]|uniref:Uncharacterized protein n=1 Tax=Pseudocohnilembus persalinus TaxID=266149 RepID=A0A0V0QTV9_PSEPJ|nr:hypothetical protein PPERSA_09834 [Pseudocohnilembus persalinus]|eukprot:KRX05694.1 hypothetical protein PPERSA_09834 [Pseudocohnilembus persalinus]